jgi:hypothetical protein
MSRQKEMFEKFAIEVAQEIFEKGENPEYVSTLDRRSIIEKLSVITGRGYMETSSQFDKRVNDHLRRIKNR